MKSLFILFVLLIFMWVPTKANIDSLELIVHALNIHTKGYADSRKINSIYNSVGSDTFYVIGTKLGDTIIQDNGIRFCIISDSLFKNLQDVNNVKLLELNCDFKKISQGYFTIKISDFHCQISMASMSSLQYFNTSSYLFRKNKDKYVLHEYKEFSQ